MCLEKKSERAFDPCGFGFRRILDQFDWLLFCFFSFFFPRENRPPLAEAFVFFVFFFLIRCHAADL